MKRRTRRNASAAGVVAGAQATGAVVSAVAPLIPFALLGLLGWYAYRKFMSGWAGPVASGAAHAAGAVPEAYGQAARTALDPSSWPAAYQQAEQAWQAGGGQGSPIAGPYYGPAGPWGGRDDAAPVPPEQGGT